MRHQKNAGKELHVGKTEFQFSKAAERDGKEEKTGREAAA